MYSAFVTLLNMSAASAILIGVVILLRLIFRKLPKKYICVLWLFVALRLCCPFTLSSGLSVFNHVGVFHNGQLEYVRYNQKSEKPMAEISYFAATPTDDGPTATLHTPNVYLPTAMGICAGGACVMLLYAAVSYARVRRRTKESIPYESNIYFCDRIPSPFVLGLVQPRIYLPSDMRGKHMEPVIAHERAHIARLDPWWKLLGFLLLSVHWFNPMVWVAYGLFCRDMEFACDEQVIRDMPPADKQAYSKALLACSVPGRFITACPLAFGEASVKQRIKSILNYRKPTFRAVLAAIVICLAVAACFLTNPVRVGDYMKLKSYHNTPFDPPQTADIQLHTSAFNTAVTIHAELWENGTCTQSIPLDIPQGTKNVRLSLNRETKDYATTAYQIQVDTDSSEESLTAAISLPENSYLLDSLEWSGAKTIDLSPDRDILLSAMIFDHGEAGFFLFSFDNEDYRENGYRLQEASECAVIVWMSAQN